MNTKFAKLFIAVALFVLAVVFVFATNRAAPVPVVDAAPVSITEIARGWFASHAQDEPNVMIHDNWYRRVGGDCTGDNLSNDLYAGEIDGDMDTKHISGYSVVCYVPPAQPSVIATITKAVRDVIETITATPDISTTPSATQTITPEPTLTSTPVITATATELPTNTPEPTEVVTEEPTLPPTEPPATSTPEPTQVVTEEPTQEVTSTPEPTEEVTATPTKPPCHHHTPTPKPPCPRH
jgi:hypothetical protein